MEQNKKRRNIGNIAGVVVVLLITGISAALIVLNQPKVRLARGISKMSKELTAYSSPAAKQINKSLLQKNTMKGPYTLKIDMTATFPENDTLSMLIWIWRLDVIMKSDRQILILILEHIR